MTPESILLRAIQLTLSRTGARLFRNNTGVGWTGDVTRLSGNDVLIRNARPLHAGLTKGSSDLIGWTPVTITAEMVGLTMAVFTAIEGKTERQRPTTEQDTFLRAVERAGGIAIVGKNENAVREAVVGWKPPTVMLGAELSPAPRSRARS
jgi:hypothetical protein